MTAPIEFSAALLSALTIGLLGGAHCFGMCGGIVGAFGLAAQNDKRSSWLLPLGYNLGRLLSYGMIGAFLGGMVHGGHQLHSLSVARVLAGLIIILMGLSLANWWHGINYLEKIGQWLWRYLQPLGKYLLPVVSFRRALLLGLLWGWLPCGLVYSALALSATRADALQAGVMMLAFGAGTLPALMLGGISAQRLKTWLRGQALRTGLAVPMMLFGAWTLWAAVAHLK